MGWIAITKDFQLLREYNEDGTHSGLGRPVEAGNKNELIIVGAIEYNHSVAVDLVNGLIAIDFTSIGVQNGTIELDNPKVVFTICEETNIVGEYAHRKPGKPDKDGNYLITYSPMIFRPIWFNRMLTTLGGAIIVVGAQTTTPKSQGRKNVKKIVSLFPDGRIGIS
jgi:hypothetical protein